MEHWPQQTTWTMKQATCIDRLPLLAHLFSVYKEDVAHAGLLSQPAANQPAAIIELLVECFAPDPSAKSAPQSTCQQPLLVLRVSDGTLAVYRAYAPFPHSIRFAKLQLDMPLLWSAPHSSGTSSGQLMHRFDGLQNADASARSRPYRCVELPSPCQCMSSPLKSMHILPGHSMLPCTCLDILQRVWPGLALLCGLQALWVDMHVMLSRPTINSLLGGNMKLVCLHIIQMRARLLLVAANRLLSCLQTCTLAHVCIDSVHSKICPICCCLRCSGIFIGGAQPAWLVAARGSVRMHPMSSEGHVLGFTPFHNPNCSHVSHRVACSFPLWSCVESESKP